MDFEDQPPDIPTLFHCTESRISDVGRDNTQVPVRISRRKRVMTTATTRRRKRREIMENGSDDEDEDVERKVVALQRIVPGGEALSVDKLFDETADYILALQCRIKAMRVLTSLLEGLEKEKMKLGG